MVLDFAWFFFGNSEKMHIIFLTTFCHFLAPTLNAMFSVICLGRIVLNTVFKFVGMWGDQIALQCFLQELKGRAHMALHFYFEIYIFKCGNYLSHGALNFNLFWNICFEMRNSHNSEVFNLRRIVSCRVGKGDQSIRQWEGINYDLWVSGHVLTLMSSSMTFVRKWFWWLGINSCPFETLIRSC